MKKRKSSIKKLWNWKINFIRKYPVWSKCMGWLEGIIIGLLIYHFFLKEIINIQNPYLYTLFIFYFFSFLIFWFFDFISLLMLGADKTFHDNYCSHQNKEILQESRFFFSSSLMAPSSFSIFYYFHISCRSSSFFNASNFCSRVIIHQSYNSCLFL